MRGIFLKGWKQLLLLSIAGGLASIIMLSCGGVTPTEEVPATITVDPETATVPSNGGNKQFYAFRSETTRQDNVEWAISEYGTIETDLVEINKTTGKLTVKAGAVAVGDPAVDIRIMAQGPETDMVGYATVTITSAITANVDGIILTEDDDKGLVPDPKVAKAEFVKEDAPTDAEKLTAKYYRAFVGNAHVISATVDWDDNLPSEYAGKENDVTWIASEGVIVKSDGTVILPAADFRKVFTLKAESNLKSGAVSHEYQINGLRGDIDAIALTHDGSLTFTPGTSSLDLKATVTSYGSYKGAVRFEARQPVDASGNPTAGSRPVDAQTQAILKGNAEETKGKNGMLTTVTEAFFVSIKAERNPHVDVVALALDNPLDVMAKITVDVNGSANQSADWRVIRMGRDHVIAIAAERDPAHADDGAIFTWGANHGGQLGRIPAGSTQPVPTGGVRYSESTPKKVEITLDDGDAWDQVSGGLVHSMALTEKGKLYIWGYLTETGGSQQNNATFVDAVEGQNRMIRIYGHTPTVEPQKDNNSPWRVIYASANAAYAINAAGNMYAWGYGADGSLGNGGVTNEREPVLVDNPEDHEGRVIPWVKVSAGAGNVYGIKKDGSLWAWGYNNHGQLNLSDPQYNTPQPLRFENFRGNAWRQVVAGSQHAAGLDMRGNLWTWGYAGGKTLANNPSKTPGFGYTLSGTDYGSAFTLLGAHGGETTMAITDKGRLLLFGIGGQGQLGNGQMVTGGGNVFADSTGAVHWLETDKALSGDATVTLPWTSIVTGGSTSFGVQSDGSLWAWGQNRYGQHGQGTAADAFGNNVTPRRIVRP